eukprot:6212749-Amphidinium_carterae.2
MVVGSVNLNHKGPGNLSARIIMTILAWLVPCRDSGNRLLVEGKRASLSLPGDVEWLNSKVRSLPARSRLTMDVGQNKLVQLMCLLELEISVVYAEHGSLSPLSQEARILFDYYMQAKDSVVLTIKRIAVLSPAQITWFSAAEPVCSSSAAGDFRTTLNVCVDEVLAQWGHAAGCL